MLECLKYNKDYFNYLIKQILFLIFFFFADVNMVAEPKPHQTGRKRQNVTKTGNDWYVFRIEL